MANKVYIMESSLKVGVIGLGRIGKAHLTSLTQRVTGVTVVAASDPFESTHDFAKKLGVKEIFTEADAVINHPEVEAIIICSPTKTHTPFIKMAAAVGKHIFCEKPLEMTAAAIAELVAVTEQYKVKLQVGFNRRFDANFIKIKQQVQSGSIGDPHILKITSRDPGPPPISYIKVSGGLFMDMTIHDFDMARFIVGSEVISVFAKAAVLVDKEIGEAGDVDTAVIVLKFENGCIGVIDNSREAAYGYDQRVEIFGSKGMSHTTNNYADNQILYTKEGVQRGLPLHFFMERYTEAYREEIQQFVNVIKNGEPVPVGGRDALMATKIAMAANLSIQESREVSLKEV